MPTSARRHRPVNTQATHLPPATPPRPSSAKRGYDRKWRALRTSHLAEHPLCVKCREQGKLVEAAEVDHITPHRGEYALLFDPDNLQSLCKPHHSHKTATEDGGFGRTPTTSH